jgi:hypothetical protein
MNYMIGVAVFLALISTGYAADAERKTYIAIKAGNGNIKVNAEYALDDVAEEDDIFSGGVYAGYNFTSGLVVEAGWSQEFNSILLESYDVLQLVGSLGYNFAVSDKFTFTPKAGLSIWEFDAYDSGFLFGGAEDYSYDGTDMIWSLEGEYALGELVQLNLSYTQGSYDFGDLDSFRFGVEFDF